MEVAYWQVFVVCTVAAAYSTGGRNVATGVAILWSIWSLLAIYTAPLLILQLFSAWATWLVAHTMAERKKELGSLKHILRNFDLERRREINEAVNAAGPQVETLAGKAHHAELMNAIDSVRNDLCILSGWIRSSVIDKRFEKAAEAALRRGASIWIGYGYRDQTGTHQVDKAARKRLEALGKKSRQSKWPGSIHVAELPTHEKVLTKDDEYVIYGSHNWLSNSAFRNSERSIKLKSSHLATKERDRIRTLIREQAPSAMAWDQLRAPATTTTKRAPEEAHDPKFTRDDIKRH